MEKYEVVKNINLLKTFQKKGFITFHLQTGTKITGLYSSEEFICCYVDDGKYKFEHRNKKYGIKYFNGCFCPYVVEYKN